MKHPLAWLAITFSAGILAASKIKIHPTLLFCLLVTILFFSLLSIKKGLLFGILVSCLTFSLGAMRLENFQNLPRCHIWNFYCYENEEPYMVKGYINSEPVFNNNKTSFIFNTRSVQSGKLNLACCGNILVTWGGKSDLRYGDGLILRGTLHRPFSGMNSRRPSYREYLYNQGIRLIMNVRTKQYLVEMKSNRGFILQRFALWLKHRMEAIFFEHTTFVTAAILDAMILGEKRNIPWFINNAMMKTGTIHILPRLYTKMPPVAL